VLKIVENPKDIRSYANDVFQRSRRKEKGSRRGLFMSGEGYTIRTCRIMRSTAITINTIAKIITIFNALTSVPKIMGIGPIIITPPPLRPPSGVSTPPIFLASYAMLNTPTMMIRTPINTSEKPTVMSFMGMYV
jgi:hypothetical protein